MTKALFGYCLATVSALFAFRAVARSTVVWGRSATVTTGAYARVHCLRDGRFMCAYGRGGNVWARFAAEPFGRWSDEHVVAKRDSQDVFLANAEFVQLKSGRILYGVNVRPVDGRIDRHPYSIGVALSDDCGRSWKPMKVVYRAEDRGDGVRRGCYEPFFLELPDGTVQLYFANEWPYVDGRHRYQEISLMESRDGGESWTVPRTACYKPSCRDGMSTGIIEGGDVLLAIETNGEGEHLHPEIIRTTVADCWKPPVGFPSDDRLRPLSERIDFRVVKGGAPYLVATATKWVLSWQQAVPTAQSPEGFRTVHLAVAERGALSDGDFAGDFTPPGLDVRQALWNSLCPLEGDSFLLVSQVDGSIVLNEGRIVDDCGERVCRSTDFPDPTVWRGTDGRLYAYATTGGGNGQTYLTSEDGFLWRSTGKRPFLKETFKQIKRGWNQVWAPDRTTVSKEGRLYVSLYNSAEDSAVGAFRVNGDTAEAYDLHVVTQSKETGIRDTIDPEVVTDPGDGRVWMFFGSVDGIYRVELAADGLSVKPGAQYVHVAGRTDRMDRSRATVFEGSCLCRHDGWWYLFVSAGWFNGKSYNLRAGRSRTLDGTFVDKDGRLMKEGFSTPVWGTDGAFYGPGHCDIMRDMKGQDWVYCHSHWTETDANGKSPRILLARQLVWDTGGWPRADKEGMK